MQQILTRGFSIVEGSFLTQRRNGAKRCREPKGFSLCRCVVAGEILSYLLITGNSIIESPRLFRCTAIVGVPSAGMQLSNLPGHERHCVFLQERMIRNGKLRRRLFLRHATMQRTQFAFGQVCNLPFGSGLIPLCSAEATLSNLTAS